MMDQLHEFTQRIDALQLRERVLLLLAGIAALFVLIDTFGLQATFKQQEKITQTISDREQQLTQLRERSHKVTGHQDAESILLQQLQAEFDTLEDKLHSQLGMLLKPADAARVLEEVLAPEQDLKLSQVNAVGMPLTALETESATEKTAAGLGRYEIRLQLEGSYLGTLQYLRALEALPWKFFWKGVNYQVTEYPYARVTLDIYTLGLLKG